MAEVRTYLDLAAHRTLPHRHGRLRHRHSPPLYLVDLPVDVVKFDISLVNKLGQDDRAGQVVADFARMMNDAGYALVAEGVETAKVLSKVETWAFPTCRATCWDGPFRWRSWSPTSPPRAPARHAHCLMPEVSACPSARWKR